MNKNTYAHNESIASLKGMDAKLCGMDANIDLSFSRIQEGLATLLSRQQAIGNSLDSNTFATIHQAYTLAEKDGNWKQLVSMLEVLAANSPDK